MEEPNYLILSSSQYFNSVIFKIPTVLTQIRLRLLELVLAAQSYLDSPRLSFGPFSKKRDSRLEEIILQKLNEGKWRCGFSTRFDISNKENYIKLIKHYLPLSDQLFESNNFSTNSLVPQQVGLVGIPYLEAATEELWLSDFMAAISAKNRKILICRDWMLVFCERKIDVPEIFEEIRQELPGFSLDFDYNNINFFNIIDGFSFLGKHYRFESNEAISQPDRKILDCFLEYIYRLMKSPLATLPEKENGINRVILALNLFYQGLPKNFIKKYLNTLIVARFDKGSNRKVEDIRSEIIQIDSKGESHIKLKKLRCPGLDDLLTNEDFNSGNAKIWNSQAKIKTECPLCGKTIVKEDPITTLITDKIQCVHRSCFDNTGRILFNLLSYPTVSIEEITRRKKIIENPAEVEKVKRPPVKAGWDYYPLYLYFKKQKKKLFRLSFEDIDKILGFKLPEHYRNYERIQTNKGRELQLRDCWELAGYTIKRVKHFKEKITFIRKEPNIKPVTTHPLTKVEITTEIQKEFNSCLESLINSRKRN